MTTDRKLTLQEARAELAKIDQFYDDDALHELDLLRQRYEAGDSFSLMQAVFKCAQRSLVMPAWVAQPFIDGYYAVVNCRAKSWDDVFGSPYPKGAQLAARRKRRLALVAVWNAATAILMKEPDVAIDVGFFERIGRDAHPPVGKTLAAELYYAAERMFGPPRRP